MPSRIAQLFAWVAALGFVANAILHVSAWFGDVQPSTTIWMALTVGLLVVWIPTIRVQKQVDGDTKRTESTATTRGAPRWMTYCVGAVTIYVFIHFFAVAGRHELSLEVSEAADTRVTSGILMTLYGWSSVMLASYASLTARRPRLCRNGHQVSPFAKSCPECRARLNDRPPA